MPFHIPLPKQANSRDFVAWDDMTVAKQRVETDRFKRYHVSCQNIYRPSAYCGFLIV